MWIKTVTFTVWMAAAASAVAWFLPWMASTPSSGGAAPVAQDMSVPPADWGPLLSRASVDTAAPVGVAMAADAARFKLLGVAGPIKASGQGVALLSIDGKPARAFRSGEAIEPQRVVQEISAHVVKIGPPGGPVALTLQAPLLPPPATGTRP